MAARKSARARSSQRAPSRRKPKRRPVDGVADCSVMNADPGKHYVLVSKTDPHMGVSYYANLLGYKPVEARPGGEIIAGGTVGDGSAVEFMDCVLMSIPISVDDDSPDQSYERLQWYGATGNSGWDRADEIERVTNSKRNLESAALHSLPSDYIEGSVYSETGHNNDID